jgi:hypothetical protein
MRGYLECPIGGVIEGSYLTSKTRRGRVQEGGAICPTIQAAEPQIYIFEGLYDTEQDR